jgi:hypothetical protein
VEEERMHVLAQSNPYVIAQNIETVKRLTHPVRDPRAGYDKTLSCLSFYKKNYPSIQTKTSLMVGLGETWKEIQETLEDLRAIDVDIVTFGQYLQPSKRHLNVEKFYTALYESLGLTADDLFDEQEFEITAQTKVTLFGMKTSVPQGLQTERSWVCRLIEKEGMRLFSVGDWIWAAALRESSQPQEMIAKLPFDLPVLSLPRLKADALPSLSGLSSLTSLSLRECESLVDI